MYGRPFENGVNSKRDDTTEMDALKKSAEMGDVYAQNSYAMMLYSGNLIRKDRVLAFKLFQLAAEGGIDESEFHVGLEYFEGEVVERDYVKAVKWFRVAAEKGYPDAQYYLGLCYHKGYGIHEDYGFAIRWYALASDKNFTPAHIALADVYMDINNPERNYKKACKLYKLAYEDGDGDACYKLGCCHYYGKGTSRNLTDAMKCFREGLEKACDTGCQYMLGIMYIKGECVPKDYARGIAFINESAKNGNEYAQRYLNKIATTDEVDGFHDVHNCFVDIDTPDLIGGIKGIRKRGKIFGFLYKKFDALFR